MNWLLNLFREDREFGAIRSSGWANFRKTYIKDKCEVCGAKYFLELHHIIPFWVSPELELFPSNVVTLCRKHHLEWGHLFSFRSYNIDIKKWILTVTNRP